MNEAEVLEAAADYIEEHGWFKNGPVPVHGPNGAACAVVAMDSVGDYRPASQALADWLGLDLTTGLGMIDPGYAVADWNNAEHRTKEQVVKELRACAADLRGES